MDRPAGNGRGNQSSSSRIVMDDFFVDTRGVSRSNCATWYVTRNDGSRRNERAAADAHAFENDCADADPDIIFDHNWPRNKCWTLRAVSLRRIGNGVPTPL